MSCAVSFAQAPTAIRRLQPSVFVMGSGALSGLQADETSSGVGGRNISITAGGDLGVWAPGQYSLAVEVRGTYPIDSGHIVGEKSVLGGLRFSREPSSAGFFHVLRPYVNVLFGRGQLEYQSGGYVVLSQNTIYLSNNSNVFDAGGGLEVDVTRRFSLKLDTQVQQWKTPIPGALTINSNQFSAGVTYRFGAGAGPR